MSSSMSRPLAMASSMKTGWDSKEFIVQPSFYSCLAVIKAVLDEEGKIKNFPGIVKDARWESEHKIGQYYDVRFEAQFFATDSGEYLMLRIIQPSGWHWIEDDGFGFNGNSSITLCATVDRNGNFTKIFELFSIDRTRYCHDFDEYVT